MSSSKKIILISITLIEIILGGLFLFNYYQKQITQKKALSINNVAVINKEDTISSQDEDLKYYWEFLPNKIQEDQADWLSYKVTYNINEDGFNDRFDYPTQKSEKTYRIVALGDSFTYGHYVDTKDNWTEQLEDLLNNSPSTCEYDRFEVINLGMPGFDVQYIVKRYRSIGAKYNPDLILWFESDTGFTRFNELMSPSIDSCESSKLNISVAEPTESIYNCWLQAEKEMLGTNSLEYLDEILNKSFESFFNVADQDKTIFLYYDSTWPRKKEIIRKMKEKYKDASFITSIPETPDSEKLLDGHPNIKGHKSLSETFFNHLKKRLDCFD